MHTYMLMYCNIMCHCASVIGMVTMQLKYMAVFKAKVDVVSALTVMLKKTITLTIITF